MLIGVQKNSFLHVIDDDDLWYDDATKVHSDPTSDTASNSSRGSKRVYVFDQSFNGRSEGSDFSSQAPQSNEGSETTYIVDKRESRDNSLQNHARYADVAHPPMPPESTKVAGSRRVYAFDQTWDSNESVKVMSSDGEQGDQSGDDDSDDAKGKKKGGGRPCKGKRRRFRKYVDKMKLEIDKDPFGFNVHTAELPVSIATTDKLRGKVIQILKAYQSEVLERLADPSTFSGTKLSL